MHGFCSWFNFAVCFVCSLYPHLHCCSSALDFSHRKLLYKCSCFDLDCLNCSYGACTSMLLCLYCGSALLRFRVQLFWSLVHLRFLEYVHAHARHRGKLGLRHSTRNATCQSGSVSGIIERGIAAGSRYCVSNAGLHFLLC